MSLSRRKMKQMAAMFLLSALGSVVLIAHGILFDLDWSQIYRLSLGGFLITLPAVFVGLLILEWVFDLA